MRMASALQGNGFQGRAAFFLHIPFPPLDLFLRMPWRFEVLKSLLAYDLVGFQTVRDRRNFVQCVRLLAEDVRVSGRGAVWTMRVEGRDVRVGSFPISIDAGEFERRAEEPAVVEKAALIRSREPERRIVLGIDRLDYTKGIPQKLEAFRHLLRRSPELRGRVTLFQVVVPSREDLPMYQDYKVKIERLVGEINGEFTRDGWVPVHYLYRSLDGPRLPAYYLAADVALVTPLKDGMNLVAKEYCATPRRRGRGPDPLGVRRGGGATSEGRAPRQSVRRRGRREGPADRPGDAARRAGSADAEAAPRGSRLRHLSMARHVPGGRDLPGARRLSARRRLSAGGGGPVKYPPIEHHGVIGDLHTVALVALDGTIDWLCLPHFDSPSLFASILDADKGGFFRISAVSPEARRRQMYLPDSNVLMTRFLTPDGVGEIVDLMPIRDQRERKKTEEHQIIRIVRGVRGSIPFRLECRPAFDYGRRPARPERTVSGYRFPDDGGAIDLLSPLAMAADGDGVVADFVLREGDEIPVVLAQTNGPPPPLDGLRARCDQEFRNTLRFWQTWIGRSHYQGRWREMVKRSCLALKLLTFAPTGAIVAAPTMSLPERIGGPRNWDYRYTWMRDAAFTVYAFLRIGFTEEAQQFLHFLEARCRELGPGHGLQVLYRVDGGTEMPEEILDHLEGYRAPRRSAPATTPRGSSSSTSWAT